ncbi:hypothetical protein TRFO_01337 [Tritrichomonas foetus]|uniref:BEACH domain-containing protein n=1 Tax=Tritrichomonas foetus TaxID=1144522 RepID=A0A1J4KBX6_9EUKA|nr:hypothetical protein TRFO_01337 [Tritrichomonas foetus]|eukprot:OHT07196.1 hypothetical protein TRFO_01337 [Tritrichomonas foetus]
MLRTVNSYLSDANALPKHKVWIEYFQKHDSLSKDFLKHYPQFSQYSDLLSYKGFDSIGLRKYLSNVQTVNELEESLVKLCHLNNPLPIQIISLCHDSIVVNESKSTHKPLLVIFNCIFRHFMCFAYQIPQMLQNNVSQIPYMTIFIDFFIRFKKCKRFAAVITIFLSVFDDFEKNWIKIFKLSAGCPEQLVCLQFLCFLPPLAETLLTDYKNLEGFECILFRLSEAVRSIKCESFVFPILQPLITILSSLQNFVSIVGPKERIDICIVASDLLNNVTKYNDLDNDQKYKLGSLCMDLYSKSSDTITDDLAISHFSIIISYSLWIISTYPENHKLIEADEGKMKIKKTSLGPIGTNEYFQTAETIPESPPLVSNNYLQQSAKLLTETCHTCQNESILISKLINSLRLSSESLNSDQYKTFAAFVMFILYHCKDSVLCDGLANNWFIILNNSLFPTEQKYDIDKNLRDTVLYILMRCFISVNTSRVEIFSACCDYINLNGNESLYLFLPFFNSLLLIDNQIDFASELIKSPLISFLINESKTNLDIFDFLRNLIFIQPASCFGSRTIMSFVFDNIPNHVLKGSLLACLDNALIVMSSNNSTNHILSSLICTLSTAIEKFLQIDKNDALPLITILSKSVHQFSSEILNSLLLASTLDILAHAIIDFNTQEFFRDIMNTYIFLCIHHSNVLSYFLSNECHIYSILIKYCKGMDHIFDAQKEIFGLLLLNVSTNIQSSIIKNFRVIPFLFEWASHSDDEVEYYKRLLDITAINSSNIYELAKTNTIEIILDIIEKKGFCEITKPFFKLYCIICSQSFPAQVFFESLNLVSNPNFDHPQKLISFFANLLHSSNKYESINSFYHFDGQCRIYGPCDVNLGNYFSFSAMIRKNKGSSQLVQPFFQLIFDQNESISFYFENQYLIFERKGSLPLKSEFITKFDIENSWISIFIEFSPDSITLYVDNIADTHIVPNSLSKLHSSFTVMIGNGFKGDMAEICFYNDSFKPPVANQIPAIYYSTRSTQDEKILNVHKEKEARFNGNVIQNANSIIDNLKTETAIYRLLPLFKRLRGCDKCKTVPPQVCKICGCLTEADGEIFLTSLLTIFNKILQYSEKIMVERRYIMILSDYIIKINEVFFTEQLLSYLISMFGSMQSNELKVEMVESFWLNNDFFSILPDKLKMKYWDSMIYQVYRISEETFNSYSNFNLLFQLAVSYYSDDSDLSVSFWRFLFTVVPNRSDFASFSLLLTIPMFHNFGYAVISSIKCIENLVSKNNQLFTKILENVDYYLPFAYIMHIPKIDLQLSAVNIIYHIAKNIQSNELMSAIYHSVACYNPTDKNNALLNFINDSFIYTHPDNRSTFDVIEFFPLLVTVSKNSEKVEALQVYKIFIDTIKNDRKEAFKMTSIPSWQFWLYRYVSLFFEIKEEITNFIFPFVVIYESILLNNLQYFQESIRQLFFFISQESKHAEFTVKTLVKNIFEDFNNDKTIIPQFGEEILAIAFIQIFYSLHFIESVSDSVPTFVSQFPFLRKFFWFPSIFVIRAYFAKLDCSSDGSWNDLKYAENIMNLIDIYCRSMITIGNIQIEAIVLFTYIAIMLMQFKSTKASYAIAKIAVHLNNAEDEIKHLCASLILRTNSQIEEKMDVSPFYSMITNFVDIDDSDAWQLYQFETMLADQCQIIDTGIFTDETNFFIEARKTTTNLLKIGNIPNNVDNTIDSFLSNITSSAFISLQNIFDDIMKRQLVVIDNERSYRSQLVKSFENELKALKSDYQKMHFKAINRISPNGRRTLISIDYNFNDHKAAALLRDFGKTEVKDKDDSDLKIKSIHLKGTRSLKNDIFRSPVRMVTPHRDYMGEIVVTLTGIIFDGFTQYRVKHIDINIKHILFIMQHMNGRNDNAAEVYTSYNRSFLFVFDNEFRTQFFHTLTKISSNENEVSQIHGKYNFFLRLRKAYGQIYQDKKKKLSDIIAKCELVEKWQNREISNYQYLYYLNVLAGRSFNDLSKYPVYPYILSEEGDNLDLTDKNAYRDLSKPIGALGPERLENLLQNYSEIDDPHEKCLYRTHFSNSMLVCGYLIRIEPFTTLHIRYQDRKFDKANRLFSSYKISLNDTADFRELIPEFFTFSQFLTNFNHFDFGENVNDVVLPKWAKSPDHFIQMNRRALESDIVSENINKWIDLMFGINRNNIEVFNVFHPNTYLENEPASPEYDALIENHIIHVGCYPLQIFNNPSPTRGYYQQPNLENLNVEHSANVIRIRKLVVILENMNIINLTNSFDMSNGLSSTTSHSLHNNSNTNNILHVNAKSFGDLIEVSSTFGLIIFGQTHDISIGIFNMKSSLIAYQKLTSATLQCFTVVGGKYLIAGLSDCSLRVYELPKVNEIRMSSYHLSSVLVVAGNLEVGVIVSYDSQCKLIFECLFEKKFIRSITLPKTKLLPFITVYKSGRVIVILRELEKATIKCISLDGNVLGEINIVGCVKEFDKYYDIDQRELLVISYHPRIISILDITTFEIVSRFVGSLKFCTIKKKNGILIDNGSMIHSIGFKLH